MIDGYVALAANNLSGRVDPALSRRRSFDRPAVDNRRLEFRSGAGEVDIVDPQKKRTG